MLDQVDPNAAACHTGPSIKNRRPGTNKVVSPTAFSHLNLFMQVYNRSNSLSSTEEWPQVISRLHSERQLHIEDDATMGVLVLLNFLFYYFILFLLFVFNAIKLIHCFYHYVIL